MKKIQITLMLAVVCLSGCCLVADGRNGLAELARTEDAHVIWHGDDGKVFWNAHAERFIYPPAFAFTNRADAAKYRFTVTDDRLVDHCFEAKEATAPLSPVWRDVPSDGFVRATCRAFSADGRDLGVVGERRFWKAAGFEPGTYPPAKRSYAEAAAMAFEQTLSSNVFMRRLAETGKPDRTFYFSCYPSKMHSAEIRAMLRYEKLRPDRKADAMKLARAAADYLLSAMQPADAPLAYFTPTYEKGEKHADAVNSYFGQNMLVYPAEAGSAFVELAVASGEKKYLDAAEKIASTYAKLQGEDGTWYLKMWEKDGKPVNENRLTPMSVIVFMESLHNATGKAAYREIADRAFVFIEQRLLKDWNWEGQFEDVEPSARYHNLTKHTACSTAMYLLKRYPGDRGRIAQARELLRFAEDQFVMWTRPSRGDGRGWRTQKGPNPHNLQTDYLGWRCLPGVTEQYDWYVPIDASAAKLIRTYLALYAAEKSPLDLAKARTLGDSITRAQRDDGSIPTHWTEWSMTHDTDWLNCHLEAAQALEMLAEIRE